MTRLHLLITDLQIGGTPRVVKELAIRLRPLGFHTRVGCLSPWGPVADELHAAGVPVTAFDARGVHDLPRTIRRVRQWATDADVVFSFLIHANAVAAWALAGSGTPLVQSIQTTQPRPAWHWWLQGWVGRAASRIVVPSPSVAAMAADRAGLGGERVVMIPNAVDLPQRAATVRERNRARQTLPDGRGSLRKDEIIRPWRVAFVGRLDPIKRVVDLVEAMTHLPDATLDVYGDGPDRLAIEAMIARHGLSDRVALHGTITSSAEALANADTLVLPSDAEGFGLVLIEAMAAGVPVVATDVPGIRDVVRHGNNGLLVPARSPPALAAAIRRVMDDPVLRDRLCRRGWQSVEHAYAWDSVLPQYVGLLHRLTRFSRLV